MEPPKFHASPDPITIFIGYDHVESVAYYTLVHSIEERTDQPLRVTPVRLSHLGRWFDRERDPKQSNDFSFSRWLVPFLCDYKGWAIWMDCDMLCRGNITELWAQRQWGYSVQVVKHTHNTEEGIKYLGRPQSGYPRKNWSSVILFNNEKCRSLTPEYVNTAPGLDLHQFKWLKDAEIGEIAPEWNHLVGVHAHNPSAKLVHWTLGGPWFEATKDAPFAAEWRAMSRSMKHVQRY